MAEPQCISDKITVGCTVFAELTEKEYRKAQILSLRVENTAIQYYVHFVGYNKRLDKWVTADKIDISLGIELPKDKRSRGNNIQHKHKNDTHIGPKNTNTNGRSKQHTKTYQEPVEEATAYKIAKRTEIEKLRTSGSMTQNANEVARVKNFESIQIGQYEVGTWYFSPFPKEFAGSKVVYICEFCLVSHNEVSRFNRHRQKCELFHPPGNEIYRENGISFFELDGRKQKDYCRRLSLLSKLFLDHKTLYYDVEPFLFYVLTKNDEYGCHIVGYFSKEKHSIENYNVACILTLPQFQRMGYGRLLISFSYELSKIEGKTGSPEKPLSDLGLLGYRAYWSETIVEKLIDYRQVSIEEISQMTSITPQDIVHTLQNIKALRYYKGTCILCLSNKIIEDYNRAVSKKKTSIKPEKIYWKPSLLQQINTTL